MPIVDRSKHIRRLPETFIPERVSRDEVRGRQDRSAGSSRDKPKIGVRWVYPPGRDLCFPRARRLPLGRGCLSSSADDRRAGCTCYLRGCGRDCDNCRILHRSKTIPGAPGAMSLDQPAMSTECSVHPYRAAPRIPPYHQYNLLNAMDRARASSTGRSLECI